MVAAITEGIAYATWIRDTDTKAMRPVDPAAIVPRYVPAMMMAILL